MTNEFSVSATAATAIVGYNFLQNEKWKSATYDRKISSISVVGSAAVADFQGELWVGEARKGVFWNTHAGAAIAPVKEDSRFPACLVPANAEVQFKVTDAPATNPVLVTICFVPAKKRKTGSYTKGSGSKIRNPSAYAAAVARNSRKY